jgi:hypothetical protein
MSDTEIVPENLRAVQAIYFAYQLEQMRMFQVVERIVELFREGLLPLGTASAEAFREHAFSGDRLSEQERADLYARALGVEGMPAGASSEVEPNRDFLSLWLRFVSSVALYARQHAVEDLLAPLTAINARVRDAARALATNASAHGMGLTRVGTRLSEDVQAAFTLLREPEIAQAFGARDMWQVIDQLNRDELGGAVKVTRYRTRAQAGSVVLQWLAAHADALREPAVHIANASPSHSDLVQAVEQWLAVSGVQDCGIDELSQPTESPTMTSPPIELPAIARDLLDALGFSAAEPSHDDDAHPCRVVALFHGPSGTGKTLAAHVLAEAMSLPIIRVDLDKVVSKYIGETEKNLDAVFARARETGAILFFDEADALFGKRSEVKEAHDRYANIEIDSLLERIEAHEGIVILVTNQRQHIDDILARERWRKLVWRIIRFPRTRP